jgi:hypothetical protein
MLSSQCKRSRTRAVQAVIDTCDFFSHPDVAYICVFWEEKMGTRPTFDLVLCSRWRYYLGVQQRDIPFVPKTLFAEVYS